MLQFCFPIWSQFAFSLSYPLSFGRQTEQGLMSSWRTVGNIRKMVLRRKHQAETSRYFLMMRKITQISWMFQV